MLARLQSVMAEFEIFADARRFRGAIEELVDRDPVGATMLTGVLSNTIAEPAPGDAPLLVCLSDVDGPLVAAMRVPGFPLLTVADPDVRDLPATLRTFAGAVVGTGADVIGLQGRREVVRQLATAWVERTGVSAAPRMWSLFYRLRELVEPPGVPGAPRVLNPDDPADVALVAQWLARFRQETGVSRRPPVPDPDGLLRNLRRGERFTLWCLGAVPVAVAGHSPLRVDGCRIAPVYTPPDRRRERFGAAVTAAAVRSAWALGAEQVTLFTDENYLPSNELYRSLGFEPIAEFAEFDIASG